MGKSRDRATRSGSDPVNIGTSRLSVDSGDIKVTAQDGTTFKKIFAEEVQVGSGNNRVIFKRGSDGKAQFQSTTDGGGSTSNLTVGGSGTVLIHLIYPSLVIKLVIQHWLHQRII